MLAGMIAVDALRGTHLDLGAILDNRSDPAAPVLDGQDIVKSLATFFLRAALEFALYNAAIVLFVCMYVPNCVAGSVCGPPLKHSHTAVRA